MTDTSGNALSDAVCGSMGGCPNAGLDGSDEAYKWNMGRFASSNARSRDSSGSPLSETRTVTPFLPKTLRHWEEDQSSFAKKSCGNIPARLFLFTVTTGKPLDLADYLWFK